MLKERIRVIEGSGSYRFRDAAGLCLVPDVIIPPKFKVLEFEKYKGTSCPKNHLTMYFRKMAAHTYYEKLLIHFFQDSLACVALNWYMHLKPTHIHSWKDLVNPFPKQYKYNIDMAPDRIQLQNMAKQSAETFKEYAHKWRELVTLVEPPLHEKKMVTMFIDTLQSPFYEHMLESVFNFVDIVTIGERIEFGLRSGKIAHGPSVVASAKKSGFNYGKKKEREVQEASIMPYWRPFPYVANTAPTYQQNFPQSQPAYRPPHTPRNAYQPISEGLNPNQAQG